MGTIDGSVRPAETGDEICDLASARPTDASLHFAVRRFGHIDEWHVDFQQVIVGKRHMQTGLVCLNDSWVHDLLAGKEALRCNQSIRGSFGNK